jgi:hypothetical protein
MEWWERRESSWELRARLRRERRNDAIFQVACMIVLLLCAAGMVGVFIYEQLLT